MKGLKVPLNLKRRAEKREQKTNDLSGRLTTMIAPDGAVSEAFRTLRTNLQYARVDTTPKVVMVTSPGPREGKSTVCANLGVILARAGKSTLLVDCDLRNPALHRIFEVDNSQGIVHTLMENRAPQETLRDALPGLKVAPVGAPPPNPAELLGSQRFADLLGWARREFEYVIIDAPPLGLFSDPLTLASQVDGVLLVFDAQCTRKGAVRQATHSLKAVRANVLGTVMNNAKGARASYHYGYAN